VLLQPKVWENRVNEEKDDFAATFFDKTSGFKLNRASWKFV
jgi:hypothetical protein